MSPLKKKKSVSKPTQRSSKRPLQRVAVKHKKSTAKTRSNRLTPASKPVSISVPKHVLAVIKALDEKKAEGIRLLELGQLSSVADYMVVATGTSDPHLRALRIAVENALDEAGSPARGIESQKESGWTVVDGIDVIVHLFRPDMRESYSMESLWRDGMDLPVAKLLKA
jgi:ribosome-associated protein